MTTDNGERIIMFCLISISTIDFQLCVFRIDSRVKQLDQVSNSIQHKSFAQSLVLCEISFWCENNSESKRILTLRKLLIKRVFTLGLYQLHKPAVFVSENTSGTQHHNTRKKNYSFIHNILAKFFPQKNDNNKGPKIYIVNVPTYNLFTFRNQIHAEFHGI